MSENIRMQTTQQGRGAAYAFLIAFVAAVGGFLFGYDLVIITSAQLFLRDQFALNPDQFGFATSSAILGCIFGPFLGLFLCDWVGRRSTLIIAALLFGISAIGTAMPREIATLLFGVSDIDIALPREIATFNTLRIVGGLGVGLASMASPMYTAEVAPARLRGRLGLMYQMAIVIGATISALVGWQLAEHVSEAVSWRWMFGSEIIPIIGFLICLSLVPRSPRWLASKGRFDEALGVLTNIDGSEYAAKELDEIKDSLSEETGTWSELLLPGIRLALIVGVLLALFNNWTGWSGIGYYLPTIFEKAGGLEKASAIKLSLIVYLPIIGMTAIAIWLVDRVGRRPIWNVCSAAMIVAMFLAGLVFQMNLTGPVVLLVILMCAAPHAIGLGCLPWLMMSEIQPTRIRAKAVAVSTTFLWIAGFTGPFCFPKLAVLSENAIGSIGGIFWLYGIICVFALIFGLKWLPETKGRTLEEIAKSWTKK